MTSYYELETIEGEGKESQKYAFQSDITIGRGKDADVFIDLKSLSRKHARIEIDENRQCKLINLSMTNPSVVNGNVVQKELILTHNDMLNIGMRRFYFRRADNPISVGNPNVPIKVVEKNQIDGKKPGFLSQLNQCFATRGMLSDAAKDEKVSSNEQRNVPGVKERAMSTPLKEAIKSRRKSIGNKRPLTEIIAKPTSIKINNAFKPQNPVETSSLKLRTAFSSTLQAALQARRVETAGRTPLKSRVNSSSLENTSSVALLQIPRTPQGNHPTVQQGLTSKPMVAIRKVLSTPLRQAIQTSAVAGRKGPTTDIVVDANIKVDIGRPSKGFTDSMRKAIHARRSSYRPTPVKHSSNAFRVDSPEHEVIITATETISSCPSDAPVDMDALTAANTRSNQYVLPLDGPTTLLPTEQLVVSSDSTPPQSMRKSPTVANSISKSTTHISWCSTTPTSTSKKSPRSALTTAIAPQRLSNIPAFICDGDDGEQAANSDGKAPETIDAVDTTVADNHIPILETDDTTSEVQVQVQNDIADPVSAHNSQKEAATRLKKLKSSHATLDLRRKKSKSPQYKYAFKPFSKKGYCDKVVAAIGKSNRLFGGMSLTLPKNKLRQTNQAPPAMESSFSNDHNNTIDNFYPSTIESNSNGQVAEGDYIQNMLMSKPILAEDAVQALAIEICAHSFANELTKEGISDDAAFESAMDSVTADAAVFSRRNSLRSDTPTRENTDRRSSSSTAAITPTHSNKETVLQSLQKKAILTAIAPPDDAVEDSDIVSLLTDAELQLIDVYAEKLSLYGLSIDEAHAVALDAYIAGIEKYFSTLESATQYRTQLASDMDETVARADVDVTPQNDISFEASSSSSSAQNDSSMEKDPASTSDDSYSLRDFFQLPPVYLDANDDSLDTELVENYAKELQQVACVDAAIAYGIALDSFLADPVTFRHCIGKLPLPRPLPIAVMQSASDNDEHVDADVNESADNGRNDDLPIPADSLEKPLIEQEPVRSNRHIYFSIDEEDDVDVRNPSVESVEAPIENTSEAVQTSEPENSDFADLMDLVNTSPYVTSNTICHSFDSVSDPSTIISAEVNGIEAVSNPVEDLAISVPVAKPSSNNRKRGTKKGDSNLPTKADPAAAQVVSVRATRKRIADEAISVSVVTEAPIAVIETETRIEPSNDSNINPTVFVSEGDGVQRKKQTRRGKLVEETESSLINSNASNSIAVPEEKKAQVAATDESNTKPIPMKQRSCSRKRGDACLTTTKTSSSTDITNTVEAAVPTSAPAVATVAESVRVTRKRVAESAPSNVNKSSSSSKKPRASSRGRKAAAAAVEEDEDTEEAVVIICDKCDKEFFVDELGISDIPEGDWFCISCVPATVTTTAIKSRSKSVVRQRQQPPSASPTEQTQQRTTRSSKRA